jgi:hypothetical protein
MSWYNVILELDPAPSENPADVFVDLLDDLLAADLHPAIGYSERGPWGCITVTVDAGGLVEALDAAVGRVEAVTGGSVVSAEVMTTEEFDIR